jgi:hypothetical protein
MQVTRSVEDTGTKEEHEIQEHTLLYKISVGCTNQAWASSDGFQERSMRMSRLAATRLRPTPERVSESVAENFMLVAKAEVALLLMGKGRGSGDITFMVTSRFG